jgi:hypothetical protein
MYINAFMSIVIDFGTEFEEWQGDALKRKIFS